MNTFTSKCGCNCLSCPTFKNNIQTIEQRIECSSGWKKYLGIKLSPEKLRACDGCSLPDTERNVYYLNCKIRKCCNENGIDNCACCSVFPCKELESVHSIQNIRTREEFKSVTGKNISEAEYQKFIEPYSGLKHLKEIRNHLNKSEIRDFKKYTVKIKSRKFPDNIISDDKIRNGLKRIYDLIISYAFSSNVSYAEYVTLTNKREQLLKMLIIFGIYGRHVKADNNFLELESEEYVSQKMPGMYHKLLDYLDELKKYQIFSEIIVMDSANWQTPTGGLRSKGWKIRISFGNGISDGEDLEVFKKFVLKLNKKYGKAACKYFNMADLSVMTA